MKIIIETEPKEMADFIKELSQPETQKVSCIIHQMEERLKELPSKLTESKKINICLDLKPIDDKSVKEIERLLRLYLQ